MDGCRAFKNGIEEAKRAGKALKEYGVKIDACYTSYLKRAIHTLNIVLEQMECEWLPVTKTWKLNERHYGALQGLNKAETARKYGEAQVKIWRRSYAVRPPVLEPDDPRCPFAQEMYQNVPTNELPLSESLEDTIARVIPYYEEHIRPCIQSGENILVAAHGNTIRALIKYLEDLSEDEIIEINIPTGVPLVYEFNRGGRIKSKKYLGEF